jgi:acylphosphatase
MLGDYLPPHATAASGIIAGSSQATADSTHRRRCFFSGRVQGVGFRYTVKNIAMRHNVSGFVRNLPDGRVEVVIEGPPGEMDQVLEALRYRMIDFIHNVDTLTLPATGEFEHQFFIRH